MGIQNLYRGVHLFGLLILLASCSTLKNLSFPLNTGKQVVVSDTKKTPRTMEFLEDISVTPGKITINNASNAVETEKPAVINKNYEMMPVNLSDIDYFTLDVMRDIYKVNLKRTAAEQYEQSVKIEWNNLKEGDLIFFKTEGRRRISHVGIYLANNKFAHASTSQGVTIGDLTDPYWQRRLYSLGRTSPQ
ncbi:MAG: NlpC/P60 family protein [Chitinophagia bacterium]|nr:NlpC/P60 family protein [Chitinophagia bacterium]